jgi:ABC-type multidrug transport system ATPase subunit
MEISATNIAKQYGNQWVFRHFSFQIDAGEKVAVLGRNGSGKSTLMQILCGFVSVNEGDLFWKNKNKPIARQEIFKHLHLASPAMQLNLLFTLKETLLFQAKFKPWQKGLQEKDLALLLGLEKHLDKTLTHFSSGMLQRVKLGLAIFSDTPLLLLDEPCANLDAESVDWYQNMIQHFKGDRTILVASNENTEEYSFCGKILRVPA